MNRDEAGFGSGTLRSAAVVETEQTEITDGVGRLLSISGLLGVPNWRRRPTEHTYGRITASVRSPEVVPLNKRIFSA